MVYIYDMNNLYTWRSIANLSNEFATITCKTCKTCKTVSVGVDPVLNLKFSE